MAIRAARLAPLTCVLAVLGLATEAGAQADPLQFMFNSGQTIQPFFDGWSHNPDGTFEFHFGYLNRNYVEELHVPVGEANYLSAGAEDRGQPTYFYPRVNRRVFSVTVPADFGDTRLVWQVTTRDETYRAEGWLQPEWEIFANPGSSFFASQPGAAENQPPTLSAVAVPATIGVGETVTLSVQASDDGRPGARDRRGGQEPPPTFQPVDDNPTLPINVPQVQPSARKRPLRTQVDGLTVTWTQLRGPAGVTVEEPDDPGDGMAAVLASFAAAGEYRFRVQASDGPESVTREFAVTVR